MTRNELIKLISNESLLFFPAIKDAITKCNEVVEKPKFSPLQMLTLSYIGISNRKNNNEGITMKDIATFIGVSKQQCTKIVDELDKAKCVTRELNVNNRREILVKLTDQGIIELKSAEKIRVKNLTEKYAHLSDQELETIYHHLHEISSIVNK